MSYTGTCNYYTCISCMVYEELPYSGYTVHVHVFRCMCIKINFVCVQCISKIHTCRIMYSTCTMYIVHVHVVLCCTVHGYSQFTRKGTLFFEKIICTVHVYM